MTTTSTSSGSPKSFVFTGWHMLAVLFCFFGTIIGVNFYMAYSAITSWSGLVADDTYVASQQFNGKVEEAKELAASGIVGQLTITGSTIRYEVFHPKSGPVEADALTLTFKRPVGEHQDFELDLQPVSKGVFVTIHQVLPGHWIVDASALRSGKRIMHEAGRVAVFHDRPTVWGQK